MCPSEVACPPKVKNVSFLIMKEDDTRFGVVVWDMCKLQISVSKSEGFGRVQMILWKAKSKKSNF